MNLSLLERPAILCQCLRCSSSLAVLENEWGRLSGIYAVPTAWLSVNLQRISVADEQKTIPQTSEMSMFRGCCAQEVSCKLCQQKLAILCELNDRPHILWKMSKVSFRDIVTMRTAEPLFKDGALDTLFHPAASVAESLQKSKHDNALVPAGSQDTLLMDPSMHRQMQHHGRSIDQISNSVNNLHDTMADLKHSFTSLRIELNDPNRAFSENNSTRTPGFEMIATVLKELKSKSDENEKMRLEMETLKLKNRMIEARKPANPEDPAPVLTLTRPTDLQSPGPHQAGKKRAWPDAFPAVRAPTVADSFDEDDMADDLPLENRSNEHSHDPSLPAARHSSARPAESQLQYELSQTGENNTNNPTKSSRPKRQRLNPRNDEEAPKTSKRPGRPRKSNAIEENVEATAVPPISTTIEHATQLPSASSTSEPLNPRKRKLRRSARSQSFGPSATASHGKDATNPTIPSEDRGTAQETSTDTLEQMGTSSALDVDATNHDSTMMTEAAREFQKEKLRAKILVRDAQIRRVMEQEEAMDTHEAQ
ncbi:hypothetical protein N7539_008220 [Penicillium diatomitis]|uniref:Mis18 domain-containing protein n=1 Tax=Penicillium diatomitis TaxID=2819901 RepID=A0A9X0BN29_9EURO|nr:uncharacterized protein N7539_008220 [Penicillium diatomitis]KAJ5475154.1 hypothetical protein N7539_008220 [Penicillium diatomitis]